MRNAKVFDVAQYIRNKFSEISTLKLQKLVFYSMAWSLAWDEDRIFDEECQAWANGPVFPALYEKHRGLFYVPENIDGADVSRLTERQKDNIDIVLDSYGDKGPQYLVSLSHSEDPWINARGNCLPGERCSTEIKDIDIAEYYSRLE